MPKYEIGYILSSLVSDDEVSKVTDEIGQELERSGAALIKQDHWGRKKLAYPIGRTRNGYYVFVTANIAAEKVRDIEHKLRTTEPIIRFIIVNLEESERRMIKDEEARLRRAAPLGRGHQADDSTSQDKVPEEGQLEPTGDQSIDLENEIEKATSGEEKI